MKKVVLLTLLIVAFFTIYESNGIQVNSKEYSYWLMLHRKSNKELLYFGVPGNVQNSYLRKIFTVKTGMPKLRPTPLPELLGRQYWLITSKEYSNGNPETSPYFLTLNIPVSDEESFGPVPYNECNGQCNWVVPGEFGLHGVNGDLNKLSDEDPGSSGCIRHSDYDITYLYQIIDPEKEQIRYYIEDI